MTTAAFLRNSSAIANQMATIHGKHAATFPPAETVRASMRCAKCGGTLPYTVSASGEINFKCSSMGCLKTF